MAEENEPGDAAAAAAFRQHYRTIFRYLRRRTGSADEAEELAAQVFADAVIVLRRVEPRPGPVLALLYALAQRRFAETARRRLGRQTEPIPLDSLGEALPAREHDVALTDALRGALDRLPPDAGVVVAMKLIQGLRFAEIAETLGISEVACRKRFQRGVSLLRSLLAEEGLGQ